jgi:hypothetical protein
LRRKPFQAQFARHPRRGLAARPNSAVGRRFAQTPAKPLQQLRLQNRRDAAVGAAPIADSCGSERVVAFDELFDPPPPKQRDVRDFARRMTLRQQMDRLKMPRRRHVPAGLVTPLQLPNAQMVDNPSHVRLPRIMALLSISPIPPPESRPVESIARKPYE